MKFKLTKKIYDENPIFKKKKCKIGDEVIVKEESGGITTQDDGTNPPTPLPPKPPGGKD